MPNIVLDHLFVAVRANGGDEISFAPKLATPQVSFDFRAGFEYFSCRDAFDDLHKFCGAVQWHVPLPTRSHTGAIILSRGNGTGKFIAPGK